MCNLTLYLNVRSNITSIMSIHILLWEWSRVTIKQNIIQTLFSKFCTIFIKQRLPNYRQLSCYLVKELIKHSLPTMVSKTAIEPIFQNFDVAGQLTVEDENIVSTDFFVYLSNVCEGQCCVWPGIPRTPGLVAWDRERDTCRQGASLIARESVSLRCATEIMILHRPFGVWAFNGRVILLIEFSHTGMGYFIMVGTYLPILTGIC